MIDLFDRHIKLRDRWTALSLSQQFAIAGGSFTVAAVVVCGTITAAAMTDQIIQRRGAAVAAVVHHIIAPLVQELENDGALTPQHRAGLDALMADPVFNMQFPQLDIWLADGTSAYSSVSDDAGTLPSEVAPIAIAFGGETTTSFVRLDDDTRQTRGVGGDFVQVTFPLQGASGQVLAVAGLREYTSTLGQSLQLMAFTSWVAAIAIGSLVLLGLFGIVQGGSRTIERQRRVLKRRLQQSHARAATHRQLKEEAQQASRSVTELTDMQLRTIGTDLHDGPAQDIAFAVLKLEQVRRASRAAERNAAVTEIETVLGDALGEIRALATSLVLPDIVDLALPEVIEHAVSLHHRRTGVVVGMDSRIDQVHVEASIAVCVFRFVQEGLNNAFHHGLPGGQVLEASMLDGGVRLSITNNYVDGAAARHAENTGIGLFGLRARVHSIGGQVNFSRANGTAQLELILPQI